MRQDKTNTEFGGQQIFSAAANGVQRRQARAECQKSSFMRLKKNKKQGESAFSDFIGFYFVFRMFGIYGFYPGTGRIIHPSLGCCTCTTCTPEAQGASLKKEKRTKSVGHFQWDCDFLACFVKTCCTSC
jgi:hypothetical protein